MSNLEIFAETELRRAGWFDTDGMYGDMMGHAVMNMVKLFAEEGHSGMSAGIAIQLFQKVANFEPLMPLTGEDDEWEEVGPKVWQNKRCSTVFKEEDGRAYNIEGRIFRDPDGACFTNRDSRVYVTFPYTPTREYVDRPAETEAGHD